MQRLFIIYQITVAAVFIVFFVRVWLTRTRQEMTKICMVIHSQDAEILLEAFMLKKFSLATAYIVISLAGISSAGAQAALDGVLSVESSNPDVLAVTPLEGGLFRVDFVGVGQASLQVSGDADLGDGVRTLSQAFHYEIYDPAGEADHFDLTIVEEHLREPVTAAEVAAAESGSAASA